jgi:hypothetical protein
MMRPRFCGLYQTAVSPQYCECRSLTRARFASQACRDFGYFRILAVSGFCRGFHLDCPDQPGRDFKPATMERQMCRNIRTLFNFEPPATDDEIRASALQFVRKLSGFTHPSKANEPAFERAVDEVAEVARRLIDSLQTAAPTRDREIEAAKAKARARERYATS